MLVRLRLRALVICVALLRVAAGGAQQPPPPRDVRPIVEKGSAIIRGRIVAADTGKPLRRARVTITAPELAGEPRNTSTDADGRYEFTDLPAGRFTLRVRRGGYLPLAYGQRRPREVAKPLQLLDKEVAEHVDMTLPRMGIISGRVLDDAGDPIEGVNVHAVRPMFRDGQRRLVPIGTAQNRTDDDGEFRVTGLAPGTYYVLAETRETWTVTRDRVKEVMGYAPTYYPGTTQPSEARRLPVQVGQRINNIDFSLVPGRAARISGTAFDSHGKPFQNVSVREEVRGEDFASFGNVASASVHPDGTFVIEHVPPGDYVIGTARGRDVPDPQVAMAQITVTGTDIDDIALNGSAGGTVTGRVITDDGVVPDLPRLRVTIAERITGQPSPLVLGAFGAQSGVVAADGAFTVNGVFGHSWLTVNVPDGWTMKSVTHDGRDISETPFEMNSGATMSDVQVVVTNRVTAVSGQLLNDKGVPITDATVIVFGSNADTWTQGRFVRATRPDQQGQWRIKGLPPGEFLAVAVDYVEDGEWNDPDYLESVRRYGNKLTLANADAVSVVLRVVKPNDQ
jgi:carboxypeptidase family protein